MSCNFQHDVTRSHYYYYDSYFLSIEGELEIELEIIIAAEIRHHQLH